MKQRVGWGLFFIAAAVILIAGAFGVIPKIHFLTLLLTVFFVAALIEGLVHLNWGGILFPLAFLAILYAKPLNITQITPWPVLGAALLGTIGLSLIFRNKSKVTYNATGESENCFNATNEQVSGSNIDMRTSFGSSIKYINTDEFEFANLNCSFGSMKVYFDNATMKTGVASLNLNVSFGNVELYIPKTWTIEKNVRAAFGAVDQKNANVSMGAPVLHLNGEVSFGAVSIIYV